jgi:hypothetical protein
MGHVRLGELPRTGYWPDVIKTLGLFDDPALIAEKTSKAAHKGLKMASSDPSLANVLFLFMKSVMASKEKKFTKILHQIGLNLSENSDFYDYICELDNVMDSSLRRSQHRNHLAEMARYSVIDSLNNIASATKTLFEDNVESTRQSLKKHSTRTGFAHLGRQFWGNFLGRFLDYHLSREIPNHIGSKKTFVSIDDCQDFKTALARHCRETALIVKDFSGCWPSVTEFREGITPENIRTKYMPIALEKIRSELAKR